MRKERNQEKEKQESEQQKASPAARGFSIFEKGRRADLHQLGIMKKIL